MDDTLLKAVGAGTVVATATAFWMMRQPSRFNKNTDFSEQVYDAEIKEEGIVIVA
ncbi:hypothetical protein ACF0H5_000045 [Mactra antiquata]